MARSWREWGVAHEGISAVLAFGFEPMGWHRIGAATIADNHRSARLLDRIGFFQQEGTRRGYSLEEDGVFHHGAVYRLLAGEWLPAG